MRVAVMNNKGGVGKTFVALALAEAIAALDRRVLVVDMDPQANATRRLGVQPRAGATLTDLLRVGVRNGAADGWLYPCGWPAPYGWSHTAGDGNVPGRIDVLPSDLDLEDRTLEAGTPGSHNRLRRALYGVDDPYDVTLIDCPPSIKGHLTTMAIAALDDARDTVVCPLDPEADSIAGALRAVSYLDQVGDDLGVRARVSGLIVNRVRSTSLHSDRSEQLLSTFPRIPVLGTVPLRARVAELSDGAKPLATDDHPTSSATAVRATMTEIAKTLLARMEVPA